MKEGIGPVPQVDRDTVERILVAGDVHGNPAHVEYLFNEAVGHQADAILQVGDYGAWEHEPQGVVFLDLCAELVAASGIPLYWIDGNHENHTLLRERYADSAKTQEGFWTIRPGVYYIPRGSRWNWNGIEMAGLGGAYSVDKAWRLDIEEHGGMTRTGRHGPPTGPRTMWWPEEEITDEEAAQLIATHRQVDILFTHDKPLMANPQWNRKDYPECLPNQQRIQDVVKALCPRLLVHGHLHFRYQDQIRADGDHWTTVVGLDCDSDRGVYEMLDDNDAADMVAVQQKVLDHLRKSWVLLDLTDEIPAPTE